MDERLVEATGRERRADRAAIVAAWVGVILGLVAKVVFGGWGTFWLVMMFPLAVVLPLVGALAVTSGLRALGPRSAPGWLGRSYRALGWATGVGLLVGYGSMTDGSDDDARHSLLMFLTGATTAPRWADGLTVTGWLVAVGAAAVAVVLRVVAAVLARRARRARA